MRKTKGISHTWRDETPDAKARWFRSLSVAERLDLLCWFTDLALAANPRIMERKDIQPIPGRVQVLSLDDLSALRDSAS
ncbi:MAG: hypothetical protein ACPL7R_02115 [Anaerolineae bacterium]